MTKLVSQKVSGLKGVARVPGDKSISHRALILGALAEGDTVVTGLLESEDIFRTAKVLISLGVAITPPEQKNGAWRIHGMDEKPLCAPKTVLNFGNSGTSARLMMGLIAGYPISAVFTGDESLSRRPMGRVIKPLAQMGARFEAKSGDTLPIKIIGSSSLRPIHYQMPVASAQVKSAILLAALRAHGKTTVIEPQPTRDHTEKMLRLFGADVESTRQPDGSNIIMLEGMPKLRCRSLRIPADPSAAAFAVVAALITKDSDVVIPNVLVNPLRMGVYDTLIEMGADIVFENRREISGEPVADIRAKSSALKGVTVPPARVPSMIDEFPILSVAAAFAEGETVMTRLAELKVKESNRLSAIAKGLGSAGIKLKEGEDSLNISGTGGKVEGCCTIETSLDHRIAMSFLVLGCASEEPVAIDGSKTIATSFPNFMAVMNGLGAQISPG